MKQNQPSKSKLLLLVSLVAVCLPLGVLWYQSLPAGPIHADSADRLWRQVFKQQRSRIEKELGQRDSASVKQSDSTARWNVLKQTVLDQGATAKEAQSIVDAARDFRPTIRHGVAAPHWPILIQHGFMQDKRVWVSVCAADAGPPYPSADAAGWNYWVLVIDPAQPRDFDGKYTTNRVFPRGYNLDSF